jgi:hypothetical protein
MVLPASDTLGTLVLRSDGTWYLSQSFEATGFTYWPDLLLEHLHDILGGVQLPRGLVTYVARSSVGVNIDTLSHDSYTTYASSALAGQSLLRKFATSWCGKTHVTDMAPS